MRLAPTLLLAVLCLADIAHAAPEELPTPLRSELDQRTRAVSFSGVALVAHDGEVLYETAHGEADRSRHVMNTVDTKFRFGSLGKMFTAVAILQLEQAGRLELDDPLGKFLPNYPNGAQARATLHQLLTHTAGAGDIFGPGFDDHRAELKRLEDYVRAFGSREPGFPPGERHEYSNYGYILLGRVIETVSGQSYADYVRSHIFAPTGMKSTDNLPEESHVVGLAVPYSGERSVEDRLPWSGTSAGGGYTTARDLLAFAIALRSGILLDRAHVDLLLTGKIDTPRPGLRYAYGFEDARLPDGKRRVGHGGGAPGMNAVLSIFADTGYVVVTLANMDPPAAMEIDRAASRLLP
ncbi:MAG TPA: serine hydrolase domain-containing protein [Steroidobacteraceae bacterium]|nr:serine hydrolase domain-containing protein [Steroidobacteraceae bacterium]